MFVSVFSKFYGNMSDPNKTPSNTDDEADRQREKARIDAAKRNLLNPSKDSGVGQSLAVPDKDKDKDTRSSSQFTQSKPSTSKKARLDLDLPNPMPAAITPAAPIDTTTDTSGTDTTTQASGSGTPKKRKKTDASKKLKNMVLWRFFETDTTIERDNPHTNLTHRDAVCKVQVIDRFKVQPCDQKLSRSDGTTSATVSYTHLTLPTIYSV